MNSRWFQLFRWTAPFLRNFKETDKVMDVSNAQDTENRDILMYKFNGKVH
jgi:hypothetical protein